MNLIYFLPRYIGALKYYAKLFPALYKAGYEPRFLLLEDAGMREYCREHALVCDDHFLHLKTAEIPFVSSLLRERAMRRAIPSFFAKVSPIALVAEPNVPQRTRALFEAARKKGIHTYALQWAQMGRVAKGHRRSLRSRMLALKGARGSLARGVLYQIYLTLLTSMFRIVDSLHGRGSYIHTGTYVQKVGALDEASIPLLLSDGWQKEQIEVVGSADFTAMHEIASRVRSDGAFRASIESAYGLASGRKRILVISQPFYFGVNAVFLDRAGQIEYFTKIFDDIRSVYSDADILFKLHPRETDIYTGKVGDVRIFHNEAELEKLIAISDLYIAHPLTAANFIIRASETAAIFINFTPLPFLDQGKEAYHITSIAKDHDSLREKLRAHSAGTLAPQYDREGVDVGSRERIVRFLTTASA